MSTQAPKSDIFGYHRDRFEYPLYVAIAAKIVLIVLFSWNIVIVMDEFAQLGYAKHLGTDIFDTVQPTKALGFAVFYKLAHLIGWDAVSIVLAARLQTALLACATIAMVYTCARALGENRIRALVIVLILLSFSNFMERIFRTISEPLALFFAVAALLVILRGQASRPRDILLAGVLSGLAFLTTQKSVYFNVGLGLGLIADAAATRRYFDGVRRGGWLLLGWLLPIVVYCFAFGGTDPLPVAESIVTGPMDVATRGGREYGGLRRFVLQFLMRNLGLCAFCFAGMILSLARFRQLPQNSRVALVFSIVVTVLVLAHDQPWPYVFIMALPFMALWALVPLDRLANNHQYLRLAWAALVVFVAISYVNNIRYFRFENDKQLELVARAEAMLEPDEVYFDAIAMLPNRREPSDLWLDRMNVQRTLRDGEKSQAYRILTESPPKLIIWSYRLRDVYPVIAPAVSDSYVGVAPNIRLAGRPLRLGEPVTFDVPVAGTYRLYDTTGQRVQGLIEIDGTVHDSRLELTRGRTRPILQSGPAKALLVLEGPYAGLFAPGPDDPLFVGVYD
jgi:hypothetical protein